MSYSRESGDERYECLDILNGEEAVIYDMDNHSAWIQGDNRVYLEDVI